MKLNKAANGIVLVLIIFTVISVLVAGAFVVADILFPDAMLSFRMEMLYIGQGQNMKEFTPISDTSVSLNELLADERTEISNDLIIVSQEHTVDFSFNDSFIKEYNDSDVFFDFHAHEAYKALSSRIKEDFEERLYVMSAYRTEKEQEELYLTQGPSVAQRPGSSEHQCGLALDVYVSKFAGDGFIKSEVGKFVNMRCHEYGFIIRYPYNGEEATGIKYEPWHIRYVGAPHAEIISKSRITLEEYVYGMTVNTYYETDGYVILRTDGAINISVPENTTSITASPDNCGNYILTFSISADQN